MPRQQQQRSSYWNPQNKNVNHQIQWNSYGIFFTCEFEKEGVREAQNIIGKLLNEPSPSEPKPNADPAAGDATGEMDIADELKKACEEAAKPQNFRRIRQQQTGVKHCLFFSVADIPRENIASFVEKLVDDCQKTQQCRFLQRAFPIEDITPAEPNEIRAKLRQILKRHFEEFASKPENEGKHPTFAVDYKKRYSDQISRQQAFDIVCEIVGEFDAESKVNLTQPDFTIILHVVKKAVLLACLKKFNQRRKFGLKIQDEEEGESSSPSKKKKQDHVDEGDNEEEAKVDQGDDEGAKDEKKQQETGDEEKD
jgi:tRNA acetyltransferase TAN1